MDSTQVLIKKGLPSDRTKIKDFHVKNHLQETALTELEKQHQIKDLEDDFPQLYLQDVFESTSQWIASINNHIVGCIGINPQVQNTWLCNFSVDPEHRKKGIGTKLLKQALTFGKSLKKPIKLITLANYTGNYDIMGKARKLYILNGFQTIEKLEVPYGDNKIEVWTMQLK